MTNKLILTGDVNLMGVTDPAVPFRHVAAELRASDVVFSNLECCLHLSALTHSNEGFFADPIAGGEALRLSGIRAVGIANNVNYGAANIAAVDEVNEVGVETEALMLSIRRLLEKFVEAGGQAPEELQVAAMNTPEPGPWCDLLGS